MKTVIMCIGNRDGGDDTVGPYIAEKLEKDINNDLAVINCGTIPENYTSVVKGHNPSELVIIDAADMGLRSGEIRIVPKEKIGVMHISTHGIPVSVLINYLEQYVDSIVFIGVQPKNMSGYMSKEVRDSGNLLVELVKKHDFSSIKTLN